MSYKIKVYCVGKRHKANYMDAIYDYEKRMAASLKIEWIFEKTDSDLEQKLRGKNYYCFDVLGKPYCSTQFSKLIAKTGTWNFAIGGATGFSKEVRSNASGLISISKFTFPHQMVRLLITEQLYRALEIMKGSSYHK